MKSIKTKISLIMLVLLIVPLAIITYISYINSAILEMAVIQKDDLESVSSEFADTFDEYETLLDEVSEMPEVDLDAYTFPENADMKKYNNMPVVNDPVKTDFYQSLFSDVLEGNSYAMNVYLAKDDNQFYVADIPDEEVNLNDFEASSTDWYQAAMESSGQVIWTEPYLDTGSGKSTITLAKTVKDDQGAVMGVIGMDFDMHALAVLLRSQSLKTILITSVSALVIGTILVYIFVKYFSANIQRVRDQLNNIAKGDLTKDPVHVKTKDEVGDLATSLNQMQSNLKLMISETNQVSEHMTNQSDELTKTADVINTNTAQITTAMEELASGAESQAYNATDMAENMQQFKTEIDEANENTSQVQQVSQEVIEITNEGNQAMKASGEQMEAIENVVKMAVKKVEELETQSKEISTLISVIQDIADQTNLLALNAAIEAARAGTHGQGFAVVADEVRKLSEQVSGSVSEITNIVTDIQAVSTDVANSLKNGFTTVDDGANQLKTTGGKFNHIHDAVKKMVKEITAVTSSLNNITESSNTVNAAVENIAAISEESAAGVEETFASSEQTSNSMEGVVESSKDLAQLANKLKQSMDQFKLD